MTTPALDPVFHQMAAPQNAVLNEILLLELFENLKCLTLGAQPQIINQFRKAADPFAGVHGIADAIQPSIRGPEVGVRTKNGVMKKTGASVCADVPV